MATDDINNLLEAGIRAAKAGNKAEARRLLEQVLEQDDNNENAWMWFASVVDTPRERRICLENVLEINPNNERARQALEKLKPNAITDNVPHTSPSTEPARSAPPPPTTVPRPLASRPGTASLRPTRPRRRITQPIFIVGIVVAVLLISLGLLLLAGSTPTPSRTSSTGQAVVQAPTQRPTLTPNAVFVTPAPVDNIPPTWTIAPTITPRATNTPTATLPPITGYQVVFVGEGRGRSNPTIYTSDGQGSNEKALITGDTPAIDVAWASTGKIAYSTIVGGKEQIAVANEDGSQPTVITKLAGKRARTPAWSPDGTKLAFISDDPGNDELYMINADGSGQTRLTQNKVPERDPAWSPDGTTIVYASDITGKKSFQLFALDLKEKKTTQLTSAQNDSYSPAWSPDGKQIAFISTRDGLPNLYVMNADGNVQRLLTVGNQKAQFRDPAWSPDGRYILYASNKGTDIFNLFVMTPDGKNIRQITQQKSNTYGGRFRPKQA